MFLPHQSIWREKSVVTIKSTVDLQSLTTLVLKNIVFTIVLILTAKLLR